MKDHYWQPRPDVLYYGKSEGMNYYIRNTIEIRSKKQTLYKGKLVAQKNKPPNMKRKFILILSSSLVIL